MSFFPCGTSGISLRLRLIRHGQAAPSQAGMLDHSRPLDNQGLRDLSHTTAELIKKAEDNAEWLWSSSAIRTATTADAVAHVCNCKMQTLDELYLASAETMIATLKSTPAGVEDVILVGHNPGISIVASFLNETNITVDLPTLGFAELYFKGQWQDLSFSRCRLQACYEYKSPL